MSLDWQLLEAWLANYTVQDFSDRKLNKLLDVAINRKQFVVQGELVEHWEGQAVALLVEKRRIINVRGLFVLSFVERIIEQQVADVACEVEAFSQMAAAHDRGLVIFVLFILIWKLK